MKNAIRGCIGAAIAAVVAALYLLWRVLSDVFSGAGLGYVFGQSDGAGLFSPTATVVVFWLLVTVVPTSLAVLIVKHLDWRDAHLEPASHMDAWLAAHISLRNRARRRITWWTAGIKVSYKQFQRAVDHAAAHRQPAPVVVSTDVHDAPASEREAA